jgi:hypothetical protein
MIRFTRSFLFLNAALLCMFCMCSAGSWYDFFKSPFRWLRSYYAGSTDISEQIPTISMAALATNAPEINLNQKLKYELVAHHRMLLLSGYSAAECNNFEEKIASGLFDTVINDNIYTVAPDIYISLVSLLLPAYENKLKIFININSILALGNLIATIRKHGGIAISDAFPPVDDIGAFDGLSSNYRLLHIMVDGSESLLKKGKRTPKEHEALLQIAAQCKELARLFYAGDPALFEVALMQLPPEIAAFAAQVSQNIKEDPKFREALITVIPKIIERIDTMVAPEEAEEENPEE